jgi:hypothetical protein
MRGPLPETKQPTPELAPIGNQSCKEPLTTIAGLQEQLWLLLVPATIVNPATGSLLVAITITTSTAPDPPVATTVTATTVTGPTTPLPGSMPGTTPGISTTSPVTAPTVHHMFKAALVKLTQWPVMLQTFKDEFNLPNGPAPSTPETPGDALVKADPKDCIPADELFNYRSEVSKLLHMMRWTWPEIINAVRELF